MNLFEKIFYTLDNWHMTTPTNYSWFHIMFICIVIAVTSFLCVKFKDSDEKIVRRIVLICWITMVVLEIYKQIAFAIGSPDGGVTAKWDYDWGSFPYQLCSTPLYVFPFIVWLKDGKLRDCMLSYIMTFSLFGGLAVYVFPNDVFIRSIIINFQTMIHHGIQVVIGIFLLVRYRKSLDIKRFVKAIPVFAVLVALAFTLNLTVRPILDANGITDSFNMFYVGPHHACTLPLLEMIYPNVPYIVFALMYVLGFCVVASIVFYGAKGIVILTEKIKKYAEAKKSSHPAN